MEIVKTENLSFTYPASQAKALDSVSISVNKGDFVLLCGPSGGGKTTLLKMLKKELTPFGRLEGRVLLDGVNINEYKNTASLVGYVSQNPETQIVADKVWHELAFGPENLGLPRDVIRKRVAETCEYFGITDLFRCDTASLSGGQKQLLNLASALMLKPSILLLDEPVSQLDPVASANFINTIRRLNSDTGVTVIMTAHNTEDLYSLADKIIYIDKGRVLCSNSPDKATEYIDSSYLPSAARIYKSLGGGDVCPKSVKEGKRYLAENFKNDTVRLSRQCQINGDCLIDIKNLYFSYERKSGEILKGLSLQVNRGQIFTLFGGNGSGKTTLLNIIAGCYRPLSGKIKCNTTKISLLPQDVQTVFLSNSVIEDLLDVTDDRERIDSLCNLFGIRDVINSHPYDLSGGQQQKAALVKLLLREPELLLLDEPTKGMDPPSIKELGKLLQNLALAGITVICSTHDTEFAAEYSTYCALLFDGEIISSGYPDDFLSGNDYYTTAASKISRQLYENAVTCDDVVALCTLNGERHENTNH